MKEVPEHKPVLLQESIAALNIKPNGVYVDATFGRGGHSRLILDNLNENGRLIAFDKDHTAIEHANKNITDNRFTIVHGSFTKLKQTLTELEYFGKLNGILLDLGVSSPQIDTNERGFSFQQDGPLDMRMDTQTGVSAAEWLADTDEKTIADILWRYGEERFSRRIARKICEYRKTKPLTRTTELADIVKSCYPRPKNKQKKTINPATRTFQAIRIYVNNELEDLSQVLTDAVEALAPGGRLVVISFHSLEDRIVKQFIRKGVQGEDLPSNLPLMQTELNQTLKAIGKFSLASEEEVQINPRSRSAKLRIAEKL